VTDDDAAARFSRLDSLTTVDVADLARLYSYPTDLSRCWVRANMIASIDGGATVEGRAGGLAGPGDRVLFKVLREVADVVLVGAGTVRAENYSGAQLSVAARHERQARGQAEVPPIAVVTASGALDLDSRLFTRT
jgi:riboflavin biosynthesis pyrimidine reductase